MIPPTLTTSHQARAAASPLARLGKNHGYRFNADAVHLQAMFTVQDGAAHQRPWALQLWSLPQTATVEGELQGHLIAQAALPPIGELADETEHFDISAFAHPPAGDTEHFLALALAAGNRGLYDEIHDLAIYPRAEKFSGPRLRGNVSFRLDGNQVHLHVDGIDNPRDASNLTGTLSLELWALREPYAGGTFQGEPLAGTTFGNVTGQTLVNGPDVTLPFTAPHDGTWHVVLMLREWTPAGYVTRDYTNFATPVIFGDAPSVEVPKSPAEPQAPQVKASPLKENDAVAAVLAAVPSVSDTVQVNQAAEPAKDAASPAPAKRKASPAKADAPKDLPTKKKESVSQAPGPILVTPAVKALSVNSATADQLAAVKGLPTKTAEAIVKNRPYRAIDDLLKVKGMGAKLLEKIRSCLKL